MTSEKQIDANRRNAQQSTGPRSDEGKALSKLNATTHGLTAETVVIKDEDPKAFEMLRDDLIGEFAPETTLEFQLVDRAASLLWRLRRAPQIEASLMEVHRLENEYAAATAFDLDNLGRAQEVQEVKDELRLPKTALGHAFIRGARNLDTLGKLSRYERSLMGMLNNTLFQLDQERARKERAKPSDVLDLKPNDGDS